MQRGYARNEKDAKRLMAAGLKASAIYREDKGETPDRWKMRKGELLGVVDGLRVFGKSRTTISAAVARVHAQGAVIVDAETGMRSDRNGIEMLNAGLSKAHGEATMPDGHAERMQTASVRARLKGRMPKRQAMTYWRDARLTVEQALRKMPGWSQGSAYRELKERGIPPGRRGKN